MTATTSLCANQGASFIPKAVVFDFDGTLAVPTLDFILMRVRAMEALSAHSPVPVSTAQPAMEELARVCALLSPKAACEARAATLEAIALMEVEAATRSSLFPFVRPMLAAFRERSILCAVITRNCAAAVRTVFPDLDEHCSCLLTRDDVLHVKPHPEHLVRALAALRSSPEEALMVGDHPMDVQVGKRAGTRTAGLASGGTSLERLAQEGADYLAVDGGELMRMLGILPHAG